MYLSTVNLLWVALLFPLFIFAGGVEEGLKRVRAHFLIEDMQAALEEAKVLQIEFPDSEEAGSLLIQALAANGLQREAFDTWNQLSARFHGLISNRELLEELSWG